MSPVEGSRVEPVPGSEADPFRHGWRHISIIVDARSGPKGRRVKLHGFRHAPEGHEALPLDDQGRLWAETLGIWPAVGDRRVIGIDGRTGGRFLDHVELVQARAEAEARLVEIRARAEKEARIRELEAELRRPRVEG